MILSIVLPTLLLLALGLPLFLIFILVSLGAILLHLPVSLQILPQVLYGSLDNFILIAVPAFIFAGEVMGRGGMSRRLIRWVMSLLGVVPGSLPVTVVGASEFFGAISGSSPATVAALGKILYPGLLEHGYNRRFALGLITSSGAIAIIIPPSINMILYSSVTDASVGKLFIAGIIPGLVLGLLLAGYVILYSIRRGIVQRTGFRWGEFVTATREAFWTLLAPVIILGGIYSGLFTPTEAAAVVAVYTIVVAVLIHRELTWGGLWEVFYESALLTAKIFVVVAAAALFSWVLTVARIPHGIVGLFDALSLPSWAVMLIVNIVLLLAGMFIDPTSAILVLTPILYPVVQAVGVDPIHFGIIMAMNLAIGMFTPPFGLNLFVTSSLFRVPSREIITGLQPFILINLIALMLITYLPVLSLWLPGQMR